jgi:capsular polysaccharide biosynthesis protein
LPLLKSHGFEIVEAARMSFREQVATFSEASHVIGTHGAGLSHMVFSPPGAAALEIFPANKIIVSYYLLCRSMGRRYRSLIAGPGEYREHYSVDPAAFEAALDEFMNGPEGPA